MPSTNPNHIWLFFYFTESDQSVRTELIQITVAGCTTSFRLIDRFLSELMKAAPPKVRGAKSLGEEDNIGSGKKTTFNFVLN